MDPKRGVPGTGEDVAARVAAHGVVAAAVDADPAAAGRPLHGGLEVVDDPVLEQEFNDRRGVGELAQNAGSEVPFETPWVVGEGVGRGGLLAAGKGQSRGAEVQRVVFKGPVSDASAAAAGWEPYGRSPAHGEGEVGRLVGDGGAVAGERGFAAVEDWGVLKLFRVVGPIPISGLFDW